LRAAADNKFGGHFLLRLRCDALRRGAGLKEFSENQFGLDQFVPDEMSEVDGEARTHATGSSAAIPAERRRHTRYAVDGNAEVLVADGSQIFRGSILDISLSGCFIETSARLRVRVGAPVEMVFRANGVMLRTAATVRAVRAGKGAGFLFDSLSERMQAELQSLIEALHLAKPGAMCMVIPPGKRSA
jgi:hypothetical protein